MTAKSTPLTTEPRCGCPESERSRKANRARVRRRQTPRNVLTWTDEDGQIICRDCWEVIT